MRPRPGRGIPPRQCRPARLIHFHFACGVRASPMTRVSARLLGPCFKTGRTEGRLSRRRRSAPCAGAARQARPLARWPGPREAAPLPGACGCPATARAPEDGRGSLQPCGRPGHGGPSREVLPPRPSGRHPAGPGARPGKVRPGARLAGGAPGLAVREPAPGLAPRVEFPGRLCGSVRFPLNGFTYS